MKDEKRWGVWLWLLITAVFITACNNPEPNGYTTVLIEQPAASTETNEIIVEQESTSSSTSCVAPTLPYPPPPVAYPSPDNNPVPTYTYEVINSYPHDPDAFTQGLLWEDGLFYEGTGLYGRSSLRHVQAETGNVTQMIPIGEEYFGEGIVAWDDRIIQITWQNEIAFVYDKTTFEQIGTFNYVGEGWGITHDGSCLIMSNGSNIITFRDPETFAAVGHIQVLDNRTPVYRLNELEYINGEIFANVWQTNQIARIDPETGQVIGWIDLTNLLDTSTLTQPADVLNGIAYDEENGRLFVTGKLWPTLFEIELIEQ